LQFRNTKLSTLITIAKIISLSKKNYSYLTQQKYIELLLKHHKVKIAPRTLRYHLKGLEDMGMIMRHKRWSRDSTGRVFRRSTAICITIVGAKYMFAKGCDFAVRMMKTITESIRKSKGVGGSLPWKPKPKKRVKESWEGRSWRDIAAGIAKKKQIA